MDRVHILPKLEALLDGSNILEDTFGAGSLREARTWIERKWVTFCTSTPIDSFIAVTFRAGLPPGFRNVRLVIDSDKLSAACECSRFTKGAACTHICSAIILLGELIKDPSWIKQTGVTSFLPFAALGAQEAQGDPVAINRRNEPKITALILAPHPQYGHDVESSFGEKLLLKELIPGFYLDHIPRPSKQLKNRFKAPRALFKNDDEFGWGWNVGGIEKTKRSLQYWINDQKVMDLSTVFSNSSNVNLIPDYLIPKIEPVLNECPSLIECDSSDNPQELRELTQGILGVIRRALEFKIPVYLTFNSQSKSRRLAMPIRKVEILKTSDIHWSIAPIVRQAQPSFGSAFIKLDRFGSENSPGRVFSHFAIFNDGTLFFHQANRKLNGIVSALPMSNRTNNFFRGIRIEGHSRIVNFANKLEAWRASEGIQVTSSFSFVSILRSEQVPEIHLTQDGTWKLATRITVLGKSIQLWNIHPYVRWAARLISDGIGSVFGDNAKDFVTSRHNKRPADLKLIRHHGIGALVFLEIMDLIKSGKSQSRPWVDELLKKIAAIMADSDVDSQLISLEHYCSDKMTTQIRSVIELLCDNASFKNTIFLHREAVTLEDNAFFQLSVIERFVRHELAQRGIELFRRQRIVAFQHFQKWGFSETAWTEIACTEGNATTEFPSESMGEPPVESPDSVSFLQPPLGPAIVAYPGFENGSSGFLQMFLPLMRIRFRLFEEGREFNRLAPSEITGEINLLEKQLSPEVPEALDWFELDPKLFFRGEKLSAVQAKRLSSESILEFKGKYYLLSPEDIPAVDHLMRFWEDLSKKSNRHNQAEPKNSRHHALEILALRAKGVSVTGDDRWKTICDFYDSLGGKRSRDGIPQSLCGTLKDYQEAGAQWIYDLYRLRMGGILADEMGLGKTIQTLAFLEKLREMKESCRALVIVPTSLTYNWMNEIDRFTPEIEACVFHSGLKLTLNQWQSERLVSITICTYGLLSEHSQFLNTVPWDVMVLDEAQNVKNVSAQRTQSAQNVPARFKLALTGTPLENHFGEFHTLIDILVPGCLGDLSEFRSRYVTPKVVRKEDINFLKLKTKPLWLRRLKSEILKELPERVETVVKLPFETIQKRMYRDAALSWNQKVGDSLSLSGVGRSQLVMLTALLRLRQICSDPKSISGIEYDSIPPKVQVLIEALLEIVESGNSALVFTQFLGTFARLEEQFALAEIPVFSMNGSHSRSQREKIISGFTSYPQGAVMLMTLKTGGVGLNLIKANYVFHIDPWWNPAVENQATDRVHRIGQTQGVRVYRYIMEGSVEEKIEHLKIRKKSRFDSLFLQDESGDAQVGDSLLTREDFAYLVS